MTLRHKTLLTTGAAALALLLAGIAQGATPPASEEGEATAAAETDAPAVTSAAAVWMS